MRRSLKGFLAAMLVVVGLLTGVRGDDRELGKSAWTIRFWPFSKRAPETQTHAAGQAADKQQAQIEAARKLRAELDWKRRAEVCQKLRQIAFETKDDELDRLAERLDQRAWDVYVRQVEQARSREGR
ncbi:MAG: hypothetical protein NZO58_10255 [Gemmataceae bacterium]|nr:hypothetical protein [Gemmataceae bacterium]